MELNRAFSIRLSVVCMQTDTIILGKQVKFLTCGSVLINPLFRVDSVVLNVPTADYQPIPYRIFVQTKMGLDLSLEFVLYNLRTLPRQLVILVQQTHQRNTLPFIIMME